MEGEELYDDETEPKKKKSGNKKDELDPVAQLVSERQRMLRGISVSRDRLYLLSFPYLPSLSHISYLSLSLIWSL